MSTVKPVYPQLRPRHKAIFAAAAAFALLFVVALSLARLDLIQWWLDKCDLGSSACTWAERGFTWWWALLIVGILTIALLAHRLTADRLRSE